MLASPRTIVTESLLSSPSLVEVSVKRMIYCSQAEIDFSPDELVELLELARLKNAEVGVTGMLLYSSQSFLQVLEGEAAALESTYGRIIADSRHSKLRLLMNIDVDVRFAKLLYAYAEATVPKLRRLAANHNY